MSLLPVSTTHKMADLNPFLFSALGKLEIAVENYESNPKFLTLPPVRDAPLWGIFQSHCMLNPFELGGLQNARCTNEGKPSAAGQYYLRIHYNMTVQFNFDSFILPPWIKCLLLWSDFLY